MVITAEGPEAVRAPPVAACAETRRGDVADAVAEPAAIMRQQNHRAARETGDVARAARAGEPLHFIVAVAPRRTQIAEAIDFRSTEKTHVHAALLQQTHDVEHRAALGRFVNIRGIAHGVEKFGGRRLANDAIFEKSDGPRRVRAARDEEGEHGKAHAYKNNFAVANFPRGGGNHQFAEGVGARGAIRFGAMSHDFLGPLRCNEHAIQMAMQRNSPA